MEPLLIKRLTMSDEYKKTSPQVGAYHADGSGFWGYMKRVGITPPHYPEFATYGRHPFQVGQEEPVYVYEAGRFWLAKEWREFYRAHGRTPVQEIEHNGRHV